VLVCEHFISSMNLTLIELVCHGIGTIRSLHRGSSEMCARMPICVMQEYDNEAEQAVCDVALHYTDTPLDIGKSSR